MACESVLWILKKWTAGKMPGSNTLKDGTGNNERFSGEFKKMEKKKEAKDTS